MFFFVTEKCGTVKSLLLSGNTNKIFCFLKLLHLSFLVVTLNVHETWYNFTVSHFVNSKMDCEDRIQVLRGIPRENVVLRQTFTEEGS